ncbi:hypothetical protein P8452_14797 [Trifolium repens]|nr:hypothetical protein P8452_14797 [Trifolium repens]
MSINSLGVVRERESNVKKSLYKLKERRPKTEHHPLSSPPSATTTPPHSGRMTVSPPPPNPPPHFSDPSTCAAKAMYLLTFTPLTNKTDLEEWCC